MQVIKHEIDCHGKPIEILPLADIHLGDKNFDKSILDKWLHWLDGDANRYVILAGDLINMALKTSVSDCYTETLTPGEQIEKCVSIFGNYRDKILGITAGNHEERVSKLTGISPDKLFALQLRLENLYTDTSCVIFIKLLNSGRRKPPVYSIYVNHGGGGGRKAGAKITRLADYGSIVDANVFVVAHSHFPATFKQGHYKTIPQSSCVMYQEQLYVNTASCLDYGGYADRQGYTPASNSYPIVILNNEKYEAKVTL